MWGFGGAGSGGGTTRKDEPLRIEAFDTSLAGRRAALVGDPSVWLGALGELESQQLYRGRTVLVVQDTSGSRAGTPSILFRRKWDLIVRVKESFEAQMLATYVANCPRPVRVVWVCLSAGGGGGGSSGDIPRALWSRWSSGGGGQGGGGRGDITLLGCHTDSLVGGCEWECILFPHAFPLERMERVLGARGGGGAGLLAKIRDGISEISASGAALVWSNIDEQDLRGGLYWYDPKMNIVGFEWSKEDIQDTLRTIADWMGRGSVPAGGSGSGGNT